MSTACPFHWIGKELKPKHLFHYTRWHWVHQSIANGTVTLSDPRRCWPDPTEWLWTNWINQHVAATVLAMCWTRTSRSEAFWRLERSSQGVPDGLGTVVRIRTSFDRLSRAVAGSTDLRDRLPGKSFLVPVSYLRDHQVERRFDGLSSAKPVAREAAHALSFKRYPYSYEREVRWVHVTQVPGNPGGYTSVKMDINALIDDILISPWASEAEVDAIKVAARAAGFSGSLRRSRLFDLPSRLKPFASRPVD